MSSTDTPLSREFVAVGLCTVVANVAVFAELPFLRIAFGALLLLFLPGYALVSAIHAADGVERVSFSVGTSIVIVSIAGTAIHFTPFAITTVTVLAVVNAVIFLSLVVGTLRDDRTPDANGRASPLDDLSDLVRFETRTDRVLTVVLVGTLLLASGSVAYAVTTPGESESFTEFYLLTENDDGELVASGYPTEFTRGETEQLYLGLDNREGRAMNYTVVVELQRVRTVNGSTTVLEERQLDELQVRVDRGSSKTVPHQVSPSMTGQGLRLVYLLYEGSPPEDPTVENADQSLYLRIQVS